MRTTLDVPNLIDQGMVKMVKDNGGKMPFSELAEEANRKLGSVSPDPIIWLLIRKGTFRLGDGNMVAVH